jgi:hypothetical protein
MNRHRRLRKALRQRAALLPPRALALGRGVWTLPPAPEIYAECLRGLPGLVEAEMTPGADTRAWLAVKRHLLICPSCDRMYFDLLGLADLDAQDQLPRPSHLPPPDLWFLDPTDG